MSTVRVFKVSSPSDNLPVYQIYNKAIVERVKRELEEMFSDIFVIKEIEIQKK